MKSKGKQKKSGELEVDVELKKIGDRIRFLRIKAGYSSHEEFANEKNIARAQFGRYERGQDLRVSTLIKVFNALNISPAEFFNTQD